MKKWGLYVFVMLFMIVGFIVGGIREIRSRAAEQINVPEIRTEMLRTHYDEFLETREAAGHYDVVYTDDGFELVFKDPDLGINVVHYSIAHDIIWVMDGHETEIQEWGWRDYL